MQWPRGDAGSKRLDPLNLFKMLVLKKLFNLSDQGLPYEVNDSRYFDDFVVLAVMNTIPEVTIVAFLREQFRIAGVIEELFERFAGYLRTKGLQSFGGHIIDPILVPVPK